MSDFLHASGLSGTSIARGLHIILLGVRAVLGVIGLAMIVFAIIMIIPGGLRAGLLAHISENGGSTPPPEALARALFVGSIMAGCYIYVIHILTAVVKTLLAGDPFVPDNISRLRIMWIVLALSEVFRMLIHNVASVPAIMATSQIEAEALAVPDNVIDIRVGTWFLVFVIAALAEVFRHGAELRRDQKLTV